MFVTYHCELDYKKNCSFAKSGGLWMQMFSVGYYIPNEIYHWVYCTTYVGDVIQ